jgi:hypothetical protein
MKLKIFISSVQKEFEQVRHDLKAFLIGDVFLHRFIADVFLFEELPAQDRRADQLYLSEVSRCDIYLGIFGNMYGFEDTEGVSPTEREYDQATLLGKTRLIYVWGKDDTRRESKMMALIRKASADLIRRRINDSHSLTTAVYASIVNHLDTLGLLYVPPFDRSACDGISLSSLSRKRIEWFLDAARRERGFPLGANTTALALLTHLNLLNNGKPTNAAALLFGSKPQQFHPTAETKCVSCHGTEYRRPFASQQIYTGDLFEQIDQARDFVLSKINRSVGVRSTTATAPAEYELPPDAVGEAIVNAVAHRDYHSRASVEVRLFPDRLEVWNPGSLPRTLTLDSLFTDHPSVPYNPLIAEPLYLTRYIEKAGSGTQSMVALCHEAGLPTPTFEQRDGSFVVTLWRDWLTDEVLTRLGLNERQRQAISYLKQNRRISNSDYQRIAKTTKKTATRDLSDLKSKGLIEQHGTRGPGVHYGIASNRDKMGTMGT